jgi:hypothetical protein
MGIVRIEGFGFTLYISICKKQKNIGGALIPPKGEVHLDI